MKKRRQRRFFVLLRSFSFFLRTPHIYSGVIYMDEIHTDVRYGDLDLYGILVSLIVRRYS